MRTAGRTAARACSTGAMLLQRVLQLRRLRDWGGCEEAAAGCSARNIQGGYESPANW
jgi:hypothetical protein